MSIECRQKEILNRNISARIKSEAGRKLVNVIMKIGSMIACPGDDIAAASVMFSNQVKIDRQEMLAVIPKTPVIEREIVNFQKTRKLAA
jgi:hypothetical protein